MPELLLKNGTVVTMDDARRILPSADVLVRDGRIAKVGRNLKPGKQQLCRVLDCSGQVVLPGLIHGHVHVCQTLFRNQADGLELLDWLRERIWPMEAAHTLESVRASADLSFCELIRSGATAALDMGTVHHQDAIFQSAQASGFRLTSGKAMMDAGQGVPAGLCETTEASIQESLRLIERWHQAAGGRLRYAFAPRFVLSCTEALLKDVATRARASGIRIHTHASENSSECDAVRQKTGKDNIEYFHALGLTGPHVTLAHCVWLTASEQRLLRETRTVVCHCPSSNLKLASGIAKVPELLKDGVAVALGADGAPCANNLDMFQEMRLAALLHKPRAGPSAMGPLEVLEMATRHGARALGLQDEVGSLEEGKRADITVVDLRSAHAWPAGKDVVGQLVYSGKSENVRHVLVDGALLMTDRNLLTLDEREVMGRAQKHSERISRAVA